MTTRYRRLGEQRRSILPARPAPKAAKAGPTIIPADVARAIEAHGGDLAVQELQRRGLIVDPNEAKAAPPTAAPTRRTMKYVDVHRDSAGRIDSLTVEEVPE